MLRDWFGRRHLSAGERGKLVPQLEPLEDRWVPAAMVFKVTNALDEMTAGNGTSLREAILAANANAGEDTIRFKSSLSGKDIQLVLGEIPITGHMPVTIPDFAQYGDGIQLPAKTQSAPSAN